MSDDTVDLPHRFIAKIEYAASGCWLWKAARNANGYGRVWYRNRHWQAHRLAYVLKRGDIPVDLQIDHLCRVRHCVNPDHLELVTQRENILRGEAPSAYYAKRVLCSKNHPPSMWIVWSGFRRCKACINEGRRALSMTRKFQEAHWHV